MNPEEFHAEKLSRFLKGLPERRQVVKEFSDEAREQLEKRGYAIYSLTGSSLIDIDIHCGWLGVEGIGGISFVEWSGEYTQPTEVAIKSPEFYLPHSDSKYLAEQKLLVMKHSLALGNAIAGVKAEIGEANQYAELAFLHFYNTGERLFERKGGNSVKVAKTVTQAGSHELVYVNEFFDGRFYLNVHFDSRTWDTGIYPLILPK